MASLEGEATREAYGDVVAPLLGAEDFYAEPSTNASCNTRISSSWVDPNQSRSQLRNRGPVPQVLSTTAAMVYRDI